MFLAVFLATLATSHDVLLSSKNKKASGAVRDFTEPEATPFPKIRLPLSQSECLFVNTAPNPVLSRTSRFLHRRLPLNSQRLTLREVDNHAAGDPSSPRQTYRFIDVSILRERLSYRGYTFPRDAKRIMGLLRAHDVAIVLLVPLSLLAI